MMALAVAMTAALGEWLCLQREMQDIQLGSGAGVKSHLTWRMMPDTS